MADWLAANALALLIALALDARFGEPDWLWRRAPHPVVVMGRLIDWLDLGFNTGAPAQQRWAGRLSLIALLALVGGAVSVATAVAFAIETWLGVALSSLIGATLLAQRSLHDHVMAVATPLAGGDIAAARRELGMIVGRRTEALDESGISRAALESLAENHSDGVIAPAFWMLVGGAPGIALYKAINTADSMIGYRSERHLHFGAAAARLDDAVNWLPARLSVGLIALGALFSRLPVPSFGAVAKDAPTHASPNAGWPETAYSLALGIALGGPRTYPTHTVDAPYLNDAGRKTLTAQDIQSGLVLFKSTCLATVLAVAIVLVIMIAL